jgi:hypothetical protein
MQQLELKHIAPYFPYELKCQYAGVLLSGQISTGVLRHLTCSGASFEDRAYWGFSAFKPILKPIGEFDPRILAIQAFVFDFVGLGKWCDAYDEFLDICGNDMANIEIRVLQAPQPIFNYLLSEHYDVFGLIDKGLAISANDIK